MKYNEDTYPFTRAKSTIIFCKLITLWGIIPLCSYAPKNNKGIKMMSEKVPSAKLAQNDQNKFKKMERKF